MNVLFDENVPRPLRNELPGHSVKTVQQMGWAGMGDQELLNRASEAGFDLFVTKDRNIKHQVNLDKSPVETYELRVPGSERKTQFEYLKTQMPALRDRLIQLERKRDQELKLERPKTQEHAKGPAGPLHGPQPEGPKQQMKQNHGPKRRL